MNNQNVILEYISSSQNVRKSELSVLFTSRSGAGAWKVRGEQIAATRTNWWALNKPKPDDVNKCDVLCVVKRPDFELIEFAKQKNKIIIYDIVDSWAQPSDGVKYTNKAGAKKLFLGMWSDIKADGFIFPTWTMSKQLGSLVTLSTTIYHHYLPNIGRNPVRKEVKTIGYEGGDYLGPWQNLIQKKCKTYNIEFLFNPKTYTDMDIAILARGGDHGSYLSRNYKSNVKLANAYGSGTPVLVHFDEMSAHDTDDGDVLFFTDDKSFERQLKLLMSNHSLRQKISQNFLNVSSHYEIHHISNQFEDYFMKVAFEKGVL